MTTAFGFSGAFKYTSPKIHKAFRKVKDDCPLLKGILDPRIMEEDDELESDIKIQGDEDHQAPLLLHAIKASVVVADEDAMLRVLCPSKGDVNLAFNQHLREAYSSDYHMSDIISFGLHPIKWSRKVSFNTAYVLLLKSFFKLPFYLLPLIEF